jgi:hypothetical protein
MGFSILFRSTTRGLDRCGQGTRKSTLAHARVFDQLNRQGAKRAKEGRVLILAKLHAQRNTRKLSMLFSLASLAPWRFIDLKGGRTRR